MTADGAPAQTAGAEGQCFEKTVVQLLPMAALRELLHHLPGKIPAAGGEQGFDVLAGGFEKPAVFCGGGECVGERTHFAPDDRGNRDTGNAALLPATDLGMSA